MASTWFSTASSVEIDRLEGAWFDAPTDNVELCSMLLEIAKEDVLAFAPSPLDALVGNVLDAGEIGDPPEIPARYVYAQLQQAKNLWNAGRTDGNGESGAEGFSFTPRPLDKTIRQLIRPKTGAADVF